MSRKLDVLLLNGTAIIGERRKFCTSCGTLLDDLND
jgi:hypothetical protein